jgi:hypothetical protein
MNKKSLLILGTLLIAAIASASAEEAPSQATAMPVSEPGHLEVIQMTAVELDGRLPGTVEPVSYQWSIIEGEGGKIFDADKQDAVFLSPKVEMGTQEFLIELTVTYKEQPPSTRRLRISVFSEEAANADSGSADDTQWLQDFYKKAAEQEDKKKSQAPTVIVPNTGTTMHFGVSPWGWGWGGSMGVRWSMNYPISQPVTVPPPGQTHLPGEGQWDMAKPVPYGELDKRFPSDVADRYSPADAPPSGSEAESESKKSDEDDR